MGSNSTDSINFKVITPSSAEGRGQCKLFTMTLEKVNQWIDDKKLDAKLALQLKRMADRKSTRLNSSH